MKKKLTFAEYVSPGHPDKVADIISQYILDKYIERDPDVRYAIEVMIKKQYVFLSGEVSSSVSFSPTEYKNYVREALETIGYTHEYYLDWGDGNVIDPWAIEVDCRGISAQSPEIATGVNRDAWGDQGVFYGYAVKDGDKFLMPLAHSHAKNLCAWLYYSALGDGIGGLDIKTEVVMEGNDVKKIIAAVPCRNADEYNKVKQSIYTWYDETCGPAGEIADYPEIILNGTGIYRCHGPIADSGVTGRKLAVDFYGGGYGIGGGAVIKDSTKADVSLNLYARYHALWAAKEFNCSVKVSLACCIGKPEVDICMENLETGEILQSATETITPSSLKKLMGLDKPNYMEMHFFGLFGAYQSDREWERTLGKATKIEDGK